MSVKKSQFLTILFLGLAGLGIAVFEIFPSNHKPIIFSFIAGFTIALAICTGCAGLIFEEKHSKTANARHTP